MEIERLDEADAPVVDPEQASARVVADADQAPERETRDQRTYRAEYYAIVAAENRAEPDSWSTDAVELQVEWQAHEVRWPSSEDSSHTDAPTEPGAWRGDGYLSAEANAEVGRGCDQIPEVGETVIIPAMRDIEAEDLDRRLIGLEHCFKGEDRIKEKVAAELEARPGLSAAQALASVPDAIRFTFCYNEEHYTAGVTADLERLTARGFELAKSLRNSWDSDQYKGINTQWREPESGQRFEVQFHTQASFEAKQLSHAAYERIRSPQTSAAELDELEIFQRKVCSKIPIPPGSTEITYAPRKDRDA